MSLPPLEKWTDKINSLVHLVQHSLSTLTAPRKTLFPSTCHLKTFHWGSQGLDLELFAWQPAVALPWPNLPPFQDEITQTGKEAVLTQRTNLLEVKGLVTTFVR